MFVIGTSFIADFAYVLLDVRDKNLLGITGVSSKTINANKITNILIYMTKLSLAYGGSRDTCFFKTWYIIYSCFYT